MEIELPVRVTDEKLRVKLVWAKQSLTDHLTHIEGIRPYPVQEAICDRLEKGSRELISVFREFGKSTLGEALACWELAFKKDVYVFYFSFTKDAVEPRLNTMREFFERQELPSGEANPFRQLLPKKKGNKNYSWGGNKFILGNGNVFQGAGADGFVLGAKEGKMRPSLIIIDDPVHPDKVSTDRKLIVDWFRKTVSNLGSPMTRIVVIGTTRRHSDLIMFLLHSEDSIYNTHYYPALDQFGKPTVPEHWLRKGACCFDFENKAFKCQKLVGQQLIRQHIKQKQDEVLSVAWSTEYMLNPVDDGSSLFPTKVLYPCKRNDYTFENFRKKFAEIIQLERKLGKRLDRPITVIGCDHAISEAKDADFSVFTVLMLNPKTKKRVLVDRVKARGLSVAQQIKEIRRLNALYRPAIVFSEINGFQRVIFNNLSEIAKDVPVQEFYTQYNKSALEVGIPSLKTFWENESYDIPYGDEESREHADDLFRQFNGIALLDGKIISNTPHDDDVVSFWIADSAARDVFQHSYGFVGMSLDGFEVVGERKQITTEVITNYDERRSFRDYYT